MSGAMRSGSSSPEWMAERDVYKRQIHDSRAGLCPVLFLLTFRCLVPRQRVSSPIPFGIPGASFQKLGKLQLIHCLLYTSRCV